MTNWTPNTWAGLVIIAAVTGVCLWLVARDHNLAPAWAVITQVVALAGRMVGAGG